MTSWRIIEGDCRERLAEFDAGSVQTCVTSPPFFGLRDYGTATWEDGDPTCDHQRQSAASRSSSGLGVKNGRGPYGDQFAATQGGTIAYRELCGRCGARRIDRQIGLEPTPDEFVAALVGVFREVRRVLRDDGTVWLNLGDSYAQYDGQGNLDEPRDAGWNGAFRVSPNLSTVAENRGPRRRSLPPGLKRKDLVGIPWMVAFALRADGWYLRSDIIWSKLNPMPESVTDRPTKSHEYLFLLSKAPRYWYDADAIRESLADPERETDPYGAERYKNGRGSIGVPGGYLRPVAGARNKRSVWTVATQPFSGWTGTVRRVRVEADADVDGKKRTTSPDCPLHGDHPAPVATGRDDGRAGGASIRTPRSDAGPAQGPLDALAPTGRPLEPSPAVGSSGSPPPPGSPTATAHSTESRRTVSRSASGDTACEETNGRTEGTLPSHGTPAPSGSDSPDSTQTLARTSRTCTCEHHIEITEKTSHFATFPPKLIEPCILAGCPEQACGECGAPWTRIVESEPGAESTRGKQAWTNGSGTFQRDNPGGGVSNLSGPSRTVGWKPSCECFPVKDDDNGWSLAVAEAATVPGTVLDPFAGAGTTGMVALRHGRSFVGIELSPEYARLARDRIIGDAPLLNSATELAA